MKKTFTILIAAIAAILMMVTQPTKLCGQATTYTTSSNITWTHSNGVIIGDVTYDACKILKGSYTSITIPSGTTKLYVHCAAWNKEAASLSISASSGVTISPTSWALTADSGIAGSDDDFTLDQPSYASSSDYYYKEFTISGATSSATITFTTASNKRAVIWGINPLITTPYFVAANVNLEYNAPSGTINYSIENYTSGTVSASTTSGWISDFSYSQSGSTGSVSFNTTENPGSSSRSATVTLTCGTTTKNVTVTQAARDFAILPFNWAGGSSSSFNALNGTTTDGLGGDYNDGTYKMKFDGTGDYIQIKTNEKPENVVIGVKMIGGSNTSYITVKGSADGETFSDVETLTISGLQNSVLTLTTKKAFKSSDRYVRLVFTYGSNVGVGPIKITNIAAPTFSPVAGSYTSNQSVTLSCATAGTTIYYTTNGSAPTNSSTSYSSAISVSATTTINAIAYKSDNSSVVSSATFTIVPPRQLTVNSDHHSTLTVKANGVTIDKVDDKYPIPEGATVTLSVVEASNYMLTGWTSDQVTVTDNEFTMPSSAVSVTANYSEVWYASFYVNGELLETKNVVKESAIGTLSTVSSGIPTGFAFKGWTATANYFNASSAPKYITSSTVPTENTPYYAVFGEIDDSGISTGELTNSEITTNLTNTTCSYGTEKTFNDTGDGITWAASCYTDAASRPWMQLKKDDATAYIKITAKDPITSVNVTITSASNSGGGITDITKHTAFSGTVYLCTSASSTPSTSPVASTSTISSNAAVLEPTGNNKTLYIQVGGTAARIWGISVTSGNYTYYNYTTIVTDKDISGNVTGTVRIFNEISATADFENTGTIYIYDGGVLNMDGHSLTNGTAANLVIEDGGQIILNNDGVQATFKRNITPSTEATRGEAVNNWYAIATSTHDEDEDYVSFANVTNITPELPAKYNVYQYDEVHAEWDDCRDDENSDYDETFNELYLGRGYLFRTTQDVDNLSFKGEINILNVEYNLSYTSGKGDLAGFNFLGNPFSENITISENVEVVSQSKDAVSLVGGYVLSGTGGWSTTIVDEIAPNQGFLVQVNQTGYKAVISKPTHVSKGTTANNDYIAFMVANSQYKDVTYAWFDKGLPLSKINHRNSEIPMIYIPQNDENFAIAMMSDDTQAFNLNFEAKTTGKYTLSYKANGEFNYLHVIDRMTGEDIDMLLEGEYSFIGSPMDNANRFIVRLGYLPNHDDNGENIFAYQSGSDVVVSGEGELQIFDVMGRMISAQRINGVETISLSANGVYILRLNGNIQKIVVN